MEKIYNTFGFIPRDITSVQKENTSFGKKILRTEQKMNHTSEKRLKNRTFLQKIFDFFRRKPKDQKCQSPKRCFTSNGRLLKPGDKLKAEIYVLTKEDIFDVGAKLTLMRNELNQYRAEREEYIKETNKRIARIERDLKETNKQTTLSYEKELNIYKEQIHKLLEEITRLKNNSQKHLIDMYTPIAKKLTSDNLDKNRIKTSSP
jgi:septal ring factor EnvC (AmiA/AmiB activator)